MLCPRCNQSNDADARFCHACGERLQQPAPPLPPLQPGDPPVTPGDASQAAAKRTAHRLLMIGAAICLVALIFQWTPDKVNVSWGGYTAQRYVDGASAWVPQVSTSTRSGEDNLNFVTFLPLVLIAIATYRFRTAPWPPWARYTLLGIDAFMLLTALGGLVSYLGLGPLLYAAGLLPVGRATAILFQNQKA